MDRLSFQLLKPGTNQSHLFSKDSPSSPTHATSARTSFWRTWSTFPPRPENTTFGSLSLLTIRTLHFLATVLIPSATYPDFQARATATSWSSPLPAQTPFPTDRSMTDDLDMSEQQQTRGQKVHSTGRT